MSFIWTNKEAKVVLMSSPLQLNIPCDLCDGLFKIHWPNGSDFTAPQYMLFFTKTVATASCQSSEPVLSRARPVLSRVPGRGGTAPTDTAWRGKKAQTLFPVGCLLLLFKKHFNSGNIGVKSIWDLDSHDYTEWCKASCSPVFGKSRESEQT